MAGHSPFHWSFSRRPPVLSNKSPLLEGRRRAAAAAPTVAGNNIFANRAGGGATVKAEKRACACDIWQRIPASAQIWAGKRRTVQCVDGLPPALFLSLARLCLRE
jgi:hypothetical protein